MDNDRYMTGPLMGTYYPSPTTADYYIGAIRPNDWVNVTVNVRTAGTYVLSSTWASAGGSIDMKVFFNDVLKNETKAPTTGGYHNWVPFPNYAMVQLDQGVQVMKFQSVVEHLNWDYIQFSLVLPDGGVDNGDSDGGTPASGPDAGGGDASSGGTGGVGGAGGGSGVTTGTGGAGGMGVGTGGSGETGQGGGSTSTSTTSTTGTSATGGSAGQAPANDTSDPGGCACRSARPSRPPNEAFSLGLLLMATAALRRRRLAASQ
jgi:MYXO-CTERM domain-containing protein